MKTCFVSRLGGAGDVLHASHLPKLIKEYYGVDKLDWETNYHGMHILQNNPYIDNLIFLDQNSLTYNRMSKNLEWARFKYDLVFDLSNTIEKEYCVNENDWRYYTSDKFRREKFGKKSYYDVMVDAIGLPESYYGNRGQLYYFDDEHSGAKNWVDKTKEKYNADNIILVNLSGSTLHKKFTQAESICKKVLERHPESLIVITGDKHCKSQIFTHDRIINKVSLEEGSGWNFRTVALMTKYMDLTVSLESGLILIAHSWDAPALQLLTAASWDNHVKYAKNAYWLQAETVCSPCHKNPREYFGCPVVDRHPGCVYFDEDKVLNKIEEAIYVSSTAIA